MSFTKKQAKAIIKKLGGTIKTKRGAHDIGLIVYGDKLVASFGIRRASKEVGHDHLPGDLGITYRQCKQLAECPMTRDEYVNIVKMKESG